MDTLSGTARKFDETDMVDAEIVSHLRKRLKDTEALLAQERERRRQEEAQRIEARIIKAEEELQKVREIRIQLEERLKESNRDNFFYGNFPSTYEELMQKIKDTDFPQGDCWLGSMDNVRPDLSADLSTNASHQIVEMRKFRYGMLSNKQKCLWKLFKIPDNHQVSETCSRILFDNNIGDFVDAVNKFSEDLNLLRNAFYFCGKKKALSDNKDFRTPFCLWLAALMKASSFEEQLIVKVRNKRTGTLNFSAKLKGRNGTAAVKIEDFVISTTAGTQRIIGELKAPFYLLSTMVTPNLRDSALSQTYAQLQGWMATAIDSSPTQGTSSSSSSPSPPQTLSSRKCFGSVLTDGFALRIFFALNEKSEELDLPTVYTSDDGNVVSSTDFVKMLLLLLAWMKIDDIDVSALELADMPYEEENEEDEEEIVPPAGEGGGEIDVIDLNWESEEEREKEEEEAIARLNALLDPSYLTAYNLKKLGTREMMVF